MVEAVTVSALNKYVRSILDSDPVLTDIALQGEISNFVRNAKTGHCYFSLKDEKAAVKAVMFSSDARELSFAPENGMAVVVRGRITLYERDGAFQVYVEYMFPEGVGLARIAFEQLKKRLDAEGLFAQEGKVPLPQWPRRVGLVTSKTGAALQDILNVAARRCPTVEFLLAPVRVQGDGAAAEIVQAVKLLDEDDGVDAIIVARGGGSAEDLAVFNDEAIARAAYACTTPLVSAIGHEIDFTILDFVADVRAPTPSAAAELVLPDMRTTARQMMYIFENIANIMQHKLESWYNTLGRCMAHPAMAALPWEIEQKQRRLEELGRAAGREAGELLAKRTGQMELMAAQAARLNPYDVLARGYAVAQKQGKVVSSVSQLEQDDRLELIFGDGYAACRVESKTSKQLDGRENG